MFDAQAIIRANQLVGETGRCVKPHELESALVSTVYAGEELDQLCFVVRSIIQNHPLY